MSPSSFNKKEIKEYIKRKYKSRYLDKSSEEVRISLEINPKAKIITIKNKILFGNL